MQKDKIFIAAAAVFVTLVVLLAQQCGRSKELSKLLEFERVKNEQNLAAMNEQVKYIRKFNGDFESSKASYIGELEEVRKYNEMLYGMFKDQENLLAGIYSSMTVKLDSLLSKGDDLTDYGDSTYGISFTTLYDEDNLFNKITGETKFLLSEGGPVPLGTNIFTNEMRIGIGYGFREKDDRYEVFAVSKSGNVKFDELDGVFVLKKENALPQKKLRWGIGPSAGATYMFGQSKLSPYIGFGVSYHLIRF